MPTVTTVSIAFSFADQYMHVLRVGCEPRQIRADRACRGLPGQTSVRGGVACATCKSGMVRSTAQLSPESRQHKRQANRSSSELAGSDESSTRLPQSQRAEEPLRELSDAFSTDETCLCQLCYQASAGRCHLVARFDLDNAGKDERKWRNCFTLRGEPAAKDDFLLEAHSRVGASRDAGGDDRCRRNHRALARASNRFSPTLFANRLEAALRRWMRPRAVQEGAETHRSARGSQLLRVSTVMFAACHL